MKTIKEICRLLNKPNRNKWVVTYMRDWEERIDIDESCKKLKQEIEGK